MKLYKLTNEKGYTQRDTHWMENYTLTLPEKSNPQLCSPDVVHAYKNMNLALLLNPIHANIYNPLLWEAKGKIVVQDYDKVGCFSLTTTKKIPLPKWYTEESKRKDVVVLFAILCAESVLSFYETKYPSDDRPRKAIEAAREYLKTKTDAAHAYAAAHAAYAAADAAYAAADAAHAYAAYAAYAAHAAHAYAAYAAYAAHAAHAAADAAHAAKIDFCQLADLAVKMLKKDSK